MKNAIKKIAAIAMAFTLLGTGTAITKTLNPESSNIGITADAACNHRNAHTVYTAWEVEYQFPTGNWKFDWGKFRAVSEWEIHEVRAYYSVCGSCRARITPTKYERRTRYEYR